MRPTARERSTRSQPAPPPVIGRVTAAAKSVGEVAQRVVGEAGLAERVQENPIGMAVAALAFGYIAGGGLFTRSTAKLIAFGASLARVPVVQDRLVELAEEALDSVLEQAHRHSK